MKTINFKSLLPFALMLVAIASAFAFQNNGKKSTLAVEGWIDHPAPCSIKFTCDNTGSEMCTVEYLEEIYQVKGKENPTDATCPVFLTREQ
jgi:hypothetical protein